MSLRDQFIAALTARGEHKVKDNFKSIVFSRAAGGFYYVGKSGSLRVGMTKARSVPVSDKFKSSLLLLGVVS